MRIVASLTTLPKRLPFIHKTVDCILAQSHPVDVVYLNIPYETKKGEKYQIPDDFYVNEPRVKIIRGKDHGPITKIYPTLFHETDPETLIVTFDDDVLIHQDVIKILLAKHYLHPNACLSFSGWCIGSFPFYLEYASKNEQDVKCDWLQGVHAVMYPRKYFNTAVLLDYHLDGAPVPRSAIINDDIWLSIHVIRNGADLISINKRPKNYFKSMSHGKLDAISGRGLNFQIGTEIIELCAHFKQRGIFHRSFDAKHSILIYFLPVFVILIGIILLFNRYVKNWPLRIFLFLVILLVLYNTVFNIIAIG